MSGHRGQQRAHQQKVFYQCGSEGSSNCICLDRKLIASQRLLPVEDLDHLASSILDGSHDSMPLTVIVYSDRLAFRPRHQDTQFPDIFYNDIIQFESVPNIADTYFLLSGRNSSVGMYFFLWFSDPSIVTKIWNMTVAVNPSVRLNSGPNHTWRSSVDRSPESIGMPTKTPRRLSSPMTVSTIWVNHQPSSTKDQNKKGKIAQQSMFVEWEGRSRTRNRSGRGRKQQNSEENAYSAPYDERPQRRRSFWRRGKSVRNSSLSESRNSSISSGRSSSSSGFKHDSVFYLVRRRPRGHSRPSLSPCRHRSPPKNRRRPLVSPVLHEPTREESDLSFDSMSTFNHPRQHSMRNHIRPHPHHRPTAANAAFNKGFQNKRQSRVTFSHFPPEPMQYTPPESSTEWPEEEPSSVFDSEEYCDEEETASFDDEPRCRTDVRVAQLSSAAPRPSYIRPPPPPLPPSPARRRFGGPPRGNVRLYARHVRDDESVQSFDSLLSEDASSTPYPTAARVNDLSQQLHHHHLH